MTPEAVTCAKLQHKDSMSRSEISHFLRHDRLQSPPGCRKIMFPDRAKFLRSHSRVIQVDLHWAIIWWDAFLVKVGGLVLEFRVFTGNASPTDFDHVFE